MVAASDAMASVSTSVSMVDARFRAAAVAAGPVRAAARISSRWPTVLVAKGSSRCELSQLIKACDSGSAATILTIAEVSMRCVIAVGGSDHVLGAAAIGLRTHGKWRASE